VFVALGIQLAMRMRHFVVCALSGCNYDYACNVKFCDVMQNKQNTVINFRKWGKGKGYSYLSGSGVEWSGGEKFTLQTLQQASKAQRGSRGIALFFL